MSEYIDRDALIDTLQKFAPNSYDAYVNNVIIGMPRADVSRVVRCKDCSMYEAGFCFSRYVGCGSVTPQRNPDDFCSYGEYRETQ